MLLGTLIENSRTIFTTDISIIGSNKVMRCEIYSKTGHVFLLVLVQDNALFNFPRFSLDLVSVFFLFTLFTAR